MASKLQIHVKLLYNIKYSQIVCIKKERSEKNKTKLF